MQGRGRTVLVVSGTGFVGAPVVRALATAGHEVTVYHRGRHEPALPDGVRHVRSERAAVPVTHYPDALRRRGFDVVVLVVPLGDADARAAVEAFRGRAGRLVAISSGDVYAAYGRLTSGEPVGEPHEPPTGEPQSLGEDAPLRTRLYPYGRAAAGPWGELVDYDKLLVERAVLGDPDLPGTVLRLPKVYGPGDPRAWLGGYARRMHDGRPYLLLGERQARWRWTHGYVEDVAAAIALATVDERAAGRVYNVGEPETPTVAERVRALAEAIGWTGEITTLPEARLPAHLREPVSYDVDLATDTMRIRRELGYQESLTAAEALHRTAVWQRGHAASATDVSAEYASEDAVRRAVPVSGADKVRR